MNLTELSIRRPVLATMLCAVLVLFGLTSISRIGIDRLPKIDVPFISIATTLQGASPDILDTSITHIIESAVNSTPGIDYISSSSQPGLSRVNIAFDLNKNIDIAFNEVQSKVNQILNQLPSNTDAPIINKIQVGAEAIMWLTLQGDRTLEQLNDYASNDIKKRLQNITGVGDVIIGGGRDRAIRVNLLPQKMAAVNITLSDIIQAFQHEHILLPGGYFVSGNKEHLLNLDLEAHSIKELENLVLAYKQGAPIRLKQVAKVVEGLADNRAYAQYNGQPTVGLGIIKITGGNTIAVIENIKQRLKSVILPQLPPGMTLAIATDDSSLILNIIDTLAEHIWLGTLLAALVVLIFLKDFRSTLIIAAAIPISLLGAVGSMYLADFTFNSLTMLSLILLIGVVVDDSIVVLENIHRQQELGKAPEAAALIGTQQVIFAVLAATLTIISIFAPVIFLGGIIGRFFQSFAVIVTVGVLISLFVAITLTPMLCAQFLKLTQQHGLVYQWFEQQFIQIERFYQRLLNWSLLNRWRLVFITLVILLSSGFFFNHLGKEFLPKSDDGLFIINFKTPIGSSIDYTQSRLQTIENLVRKHPEVASVFSYISSYTGTSLVRLKPANQRQLKQYDLIPLVRKELATLPGVQAFPTAPAIVGGGRGDPLQFIVEGPSLNLVAKYSQLLLSQLQNNPGLGQVDLDLQLAQPQYNLSFDRTRAQSLGLNAQELAQTLSIIGGGFDVAKYSEKNGNGTRYNVRLQAVPGLVTQPSDLQQIYLRNNQGNLLRLDNVAKLTETLGPAIITRSDLEYAATFYATPLIPLGSAVDFVKATASKLLPIGYELKLRGEAEEFAKTSKYISFAFTLAIVLVYMVLASQFNSFIQPLILMLALPLAVLGGLAALWLVNMTLNIYSMIGMVLLMGLVAKNSILLIDLTNQLRSEGKSVDAALRTACPLRMRPVLMTSLTIILALLPSALGQGPGVDTNGPLAVAVIGGMISSTLLTLVVIPSVYSLVENWRNKTISR